MEWKIGEIFEFKKDWYQCVEGRCKDCHFSEKRFLCKQFITKDFCTHGIIFKKLEKVGEPYEYFIQGVGIIMVQEYILANTNYIWEYNQDVVVMDCQNGKVAIEIKQNKEDMGEKSLNLKPFDLEKAKAGKPVCTRDGRKARIICFDYDGETGDYPIVALVSYNKGNNCYERVLKYTSDGIFNKYSGQEHDEDLMMLPEKKEGWVNVYKGIDGITFSRHPYISKEEAIKEAGGALSGRIDTIKVYWEE